jgi:ubiquitin carboxyl-terminal hydrolase 10
MESDTPLVDAMIMFMREFNVLASAESSDALRMQLTQQQLEQYGKSVTPQYVYDAIAKLDRFNSMRVSRYGFNARL